MIYIGIVVLVFVLDWYVKKQMEEQLEENTVREVCHDKILLRKLHNHGIALGMFRDKPKLVLGGTAAAVSLLIGMFIKLLRMDGQNLQKIGFACMLGGGLNNLADRKVHGYVRDYFSFGVKWKKLRRLVFNLSDMFVFLGAALMFLGELFKKTK